jgi:hypothetical protein
MASWLAEAYLAKTGFKGQETGEPAAPGRRDYLEQPLDAERDHGAHGSFGDRAHSRSPQTWMAQRRGPVAAVAGALGVAASALLVRRSR